MGQPSRASQARRAALEEQLKPARGADEGRDETGAVVLDNDDSDVATTSTDVAMVSGKKVKRKGVPGLGL